MRFALTWPAAILLVLLAGAGLSQNNKDPYAGHVAQTPPRSPAEEQKLLHVPPGFEVQLVAAEPDIHKPINLAFDERGRLWVTDSVEYPFAAGKDKQPRDTVKVLEDFDETGRARKITTFAGGLNIPIGVLPLTPRGEEPKGDAALVFSIPKISRFTAPTAAIRCWLARAPPGRSPPQTVGVP